MPLCGSSSKTTFGRRPVRRQLKISTASSKFERSRCNERWWFVEMALVVWSMSLSRTFIKILWQNRVFPFTYNRQNITLKCIHKRLLHTSIVRRLLTPWTYEMNSMQWTDRLRELRAWSVCGRAACRAEFMGYCWYVPSGNIGLLAVLIHKGTRTRGIWPAKVPQLCGNARHHDMFLCESFTRIDAHVEVTLVNLYLGGQSNIIGERRVEGRSLKLQSSWYMTNPVF